MKAEDTIEHITARIEEHLTNGVAPWVRPWSTGSITAPMNPATGKTYQGLNNLFLTMAQVGHETSCWLTFNQARESGGNVMKGAKGYPVLRPLEIRKGFNEAAEGQGDDEAQRLLLFKGYTVFNLDQCEGLDHLRPEDTTASRNPVQRDPRIDETIAATRADIRHGGDLCYYRPAEDRIQMVEPERFITVDHYYATTLHELGHWTGAKQRLDRFGNEPPKLAAYAYEELVAELTSAFCCQALGIDGLDRHNAAYIGSWLQGLKGDRKMIAKAAADADRARKLILTPTN